MNTSVRIAALVAVAAAATGCSSFRQAVGVEKIVPDEFLTIQKAPLVVPPDFALRPPQAGDARPSALRAEGEAESSVFGRDLGRNASPGERALVELAGATAADPGIRRQVDLEAADVVYKPEAFADRVIGAEQTAALTEVTEEERERRLKEEESIRRVTGGGTVVIARERPRSKLPGL